MTQKEDIFLGCVWCGDIMDMPSEDLLKKFGPTALKCCGFEMVKLSRENLYKLLKGLDKLKAAVENEITKDF